ncbi:MAG: aminotransferase class V-fold PLP-dependent enzyme [Victivallales bacterium]|nr:aminotransferase class V-fold PLP-dependent enzyme [Victivallales bacterium]
MTALPSPIYLDNAAAALPHPSLAQWYAELLPQYPWNPHGGTCYAEQARRLVLRAGQRLLAALHIPEDEATVLWTSGVTEATNLAAHVRLPDSPVVFLDPGAHAALLAPLAPFSPQALLLANNGALSLPSCQRCDLLALSCVNNETGAIPDLPALRHKLASCSGARMLLVDAAQALGKHPIPWNAAHIDLLALSSRKIGGPAAVGALIVRKGTPLHAHILGGGQQNKLRSGTLDVVGIEMFTRVAEETCAQSASHGEVVTLLNRLLWNGLETLSLPRWQRISPENGSPYIAMFSFPGYEGAVLVRILAEHHHVLVSSASACSAEEGIPSHTILGMGFSRDVANGAIRVSLSHRNTSDDIQTFLQALTLTLQDY